MSKDEPIVAGQIVLVDWRDAPCYALAHHVTTTSKLRVRPTPSQIEPAQLESIRRLIAVALGLLAAEGHGQQRR